MIQELNLSPMGYLILLIVVAILAYLIVTTPNKVDTENTVNDSKNTVDTPAYLSRYGAVIQIQGK
ncbi:hypothetical protein JavanS54_0022 [Streptococcus satellite phage Javan54]|uniref:hypothetical protein n=1 Tax=Streptococcus agalactiae TaxID=1311 RepID=UPI000332E543|nr:hypothetical protein [Streptococcus agalactiae]QBX11079.1 hypothetical protein JavanS54_0022 [Streptococcus satellite phage Javan54]CCW41061.1 hypothetical protein MSA_22070 [Streptococcus agalactiae ILRI005]